MKIKKLLSDNEKLMSEWDYEKNKDIDLSKIKDVLGKVDIIRWIICFDDLERFGLPVNEILGFINRLVEHNHCKVIILANEKKLAH